MILKWAARITAAVMAGLIAVIFVGEAFSEGFEGFGLRDGIMMIPFLLVWAGYILGWKKEMAGGVLIVLCMAVFSILNYAFAGRFPDGLFFFLMAVPGFLYITSASRRKRQQG